MKINDPTQTTSLSQGVLILRKSGEEFVAKFSGEFARAAAGVVLQNEGALSFNSQAEVVARAITTHHWAVGASGYEAYAASDEPHRE